MLKRIHTLPWKNITLIGLAVGFLFASVFFIWVATLEVPTLDGFETRRITQSTKIYDRTGEVLLFDLHEDVRRTVVPLEEVSRNLKNATIAIEDAEFYEHNGIKPTAILRAVLVNLRLIDGIIGQGGSTITQQVVKNTLLTRERTISRKVKEWILALKVEQLITKDEILELYLNEVPYGGNIYGAEEASKHFFSVSSAELSLAQAAYLAAMPQAPTRYSPYGNNVPLLEARKNLVLERMHTLGFITTEELENARSEEVSFEQYGDTNIKAPHFVFFVREYLEEEYGREAVYESGLTVTTTLDAELQQIGEEVVREFAFKNEEDFNAENAALVAVDPNNGHILTMVGSRDYFDETIDGKFNITTAKRQPGSTFKPFVYGAAFEKGYTPETVVFDVPTQFSNACEISNFSTGGNCYSPVNYDAVFRGPMTFRNALAQSINIPAVKALYLVGVDNVIETAKRLGITTLDKGRGFYGLTLVLGGGEVTLLELTNAYGTLGNDGVHHPYTAILKVEDAAGTILEEYEESAGTQALSVQAARQVANVLTDVEARVPAYGQNSFFFGSQQVAVKTGTTNDFRDVWIMGYTPNIAVGTWGGNNDNSPIVKRVAGFVLAPMWRSFMDRALPLVPAENFTPPAPELNPEELKPVLRGFWQGSSENGAPVVHSILHWVDRKNPRGSVPNNPESDPQYNLWEFGVQTWAQANAPQLIGSGAPGSTLPGVPDYAQPGVPEQGALTIINPAPNSTQALGVPLEVRVVTPETLPLESVEYYLNGAFMGASNQSPFALTIVPQSSGTHTLRAVGRAGFAGTQEAQVQFNVQ